MVRLSDNHPRGPQADPEQRVAKFRICVTGLRGVPRVMGGVESHCEQLLPRLKTLMPDVEFTILARQPYTRPHAYNFAGMRVRPLPAIRDKLMEAPSNTLLAVLYTRFVAKADLLWVHAIGPGLFIPLARLLGLKVLLTHHGQDYRRLRWSRLGRLALRWGELMGVSAAHRVIAVSPSLADDLQERFPHRVNNVIYIPNGATRLPSSTEQEANSVLSELGLTPGEFIVSAGRLVPEKGFDDLVDAFEAIDTDQKLVIAGRADNEDGYSEQLRARASLRVLFPGYRDGGSLRVFYENASLFVLPSYHEGLAIAALEAMEAGAPILLSNISANLDLGLPAKHYFPAGDTAALRERLSRPHESLKTDYSPLLTRFDWDAVAAKTASVLNELKTIGPRQIWDYLGPRRWRAPAHEINSCAA